MKQTAVDFAFEKLANQGLLVTKDYKNLVTYRESKEMEKEQIMNAWENGWENDSVRDDEVESAATKYYNETFNQ
jgi:hypothetical protein